MKEKMTTADIYDQLERSETLAGHEGPLHNYLVAQIAKYDEGEDPEELAYEIAGLMSAKVVVGLPGDSPYMKVLSLAGDLELPVQQRSASANWEELKRLILALPE